MQTLVSSSPVFNSIDTALSETARDLRSKVRSAVDPPRTSRHVRRAEMKKNLWRDVVSLVRRTADTSAIRRMLASASWSETFIDAALATVPSPDIAVDADGEILFEWLSGPC